MSLASDDGINGGKLKSPAVVSSPKFGGLRDRVEIDLVMVKGV